MGRSDPVAREFESAVLNSGEWQSLQWEMTWILLPGSRWLGIQESKEGGLRFGKPEQKQKEASQNQKACTVRSEEGRTAQDRSERWVRGSRTQKKVLTTDS